MKKNIFFCFLAILFCISVHAQDTLYVKTAGSGAWAERTAYTNLQDAIDAAQSGDQIWVAAGTYLPTSNTPNNTDARGKAFILKSGIRIIGGFNGDEQSADERALNSMAAYDFTHATILSGDLNQTLDLATDNAYHVVYGVNCDSVTLDGLTITGGYANRTAYTSDQKGGGIYLGTSTTASSHCALTRCRIVYNTAQLNGGGAYLPKECAISDCEVLHNRVLAVNSSGGGLYVDNNSFATMVAQNCVFGFNGCTATTTPSSTSRYGGGAVSCGNNCQFDHCVFMANTCSNPGGAIYGAANNQFTNCKFYDNFGSMGAALYTAATASLKVSNCLFANNVANSQGGALYSTGSTCVGVNCTFVNNTAATAGALYVGNGFTLFNSIVANNGAAGNQISGLTTEKCMYSAIVDENYGGTGCVQVTSEEIAFRNPYTVQGALESEEELPALQNADFSLYGTSACVNAGNSGTYYLSGYQFPETDLAGNPRINGGSIDLGCYETQCVTDTLAFDYMPTDTIYNDTLPGTGVIQLTVSISNFNAAYRYTLQMAGETSILSESTFEVEVAFPGEIMFTVARFDTICGCTEVAEGAFACLDSLFAPVGLAEYHTGFSAIYPNPATDFVTVENVEGSVNGQLALYDLSGHRILCVPASGGQQVLNISNCASGIYILKYWANGQIVATEKIIKK